MTRDFAAFLAALNDAGASYLVIGGMAVLSHIPYRTTRDIDVLIDPTLINACKVREAVGSWGGFEPEYSAEEFISGDIDLISMKEAAGRSEKDLPDLRRLKRLRERGKRPG